MKQIIPFSKDITFKTVIGEITGISLDNDLSMKEDNLVKGNFYIKGSYKMMKSSALEENYSYKIPCEIAISEDYDTSSSFIDIDDFNYEVVGDDKLRVSISVSIDNLERKEHIEVLNDKIDEILGKDEIKLDNVNDKREELNDMKEKEEKNEKSVTLEERDVIDPLNVINESNPSLLSFDGDEEYRTYSVYLYKEEDTIESILEKYKVSKLDLMDYNDLDNLTVGTKLIIPAGNDEWNKRIFEEV